LATALREFVAKLRQRLAVAGIDLTGPLEVTSDGLGGVQVGSERADRAAIEQALSGDEQLLAEFHNLAEQHQALADDDARLADFGLLIQDDDAEVVWR
jgi:hypothetical protein